MKQIWQHLIPKHLISKIAGSLARCKITLVKNFLIDLFIKHYKIPMHEAVITDPHAYSCLEDFFIRQVDANKRPFTENQNALCSPVDGRISQFGNINCSTLIQAKGFNYSASALLHEDAQKFYNGKFITIYLAPSNFHRVYMPTTGTLQKIIYIPGSLFSVNNKTAASIPNLYTRNERLIIQFKNYQGSFALVMVGALIVSGIHSPWTKTQPNRIVNGNIKIWDFVDNNIEVTRSSEIGYFTFGSTVIMLLPNNSSEFSSTVEIDQPVRIGEIITEGS